MSSVSSSSRRTSALPEEGLRERKKRRTREAIRSAAFRLFEEQGWEATTTEQIAAAAEVSPSTFFRYFATKEQLVLSDDYDPIIAAELRARPADEPLLDSLRHAVLAPLRQIVEEDRAALLLRVRLVKEVPALRVMMYEASDETRDMLRDWLAERTGRTADDLAVRAATGALIGAMTEVVLDWVDSGATDDLATLFDTSMRGLAELLH
ncbi:TetR family transcriptional regulator [Mangrovactinospora gilvigrisea]|nr:TetR family transcriptional regulator [Mangrovactinospora gilvigrisea]